MEIKGKYILTILTFSMIFEPESSMELKSYTACYGILGLQNFLLPSCPAGQKIAVMAVYMLAKYKSTGCPQIQTLPGDDPACCQYDVTDCSYLYDSGSFRAYYQTCNGKSSCQIQVSWIDIPSHCNSSVYIERTHYMKMDYYCISDQAVDPCTDLTTSDSPAFFWNTGYPAEMTTTNKSCTCSIEMSCDTTVELTAIDLQLKDPGNCKQSLVVTDGSFSSTYDCSSNNDFLPRVMYTSTSHFVTIVFTNNLGITGGKFFIRIQGTNRTGEVTLSCGASALTMSSQNPSSLPTCPGEGDTTTNLPTNGQSTQTDNSTTLTAMSTKDPITLTAMPTKDSTTLTAMSTKDSTTLTALSTKDFTTLTRTSTSTENSTTLIAISTKDSTTLTSMSTEDSTTLTRTSTSTEDSTTLTSMSTEDSTSPTFMSTTDSTTLTAMSTENSTTPTAMSTKDSTTLTTMLIDSSTTKYSTKAHVMTSVSFTATNTVLTTEDSKISTALTTASPSTLLNVKTENSTTLTSQTIEDFKTSTASTIEDSTTPTDQTTEDFTTKAARTTENSTTSTARTTGDFTKLSDMSTDSTTLSLSTQDATTSGFSLNMTTVFNVSIESTSDHSPSPQTSTYSHTVIATEPCCKDSNATVKTHNGVNLPVVTCITIAVLLVIGIGLLVILCDCYLRRRCCFRNRGTTYSIPLQLEGLYNHTVN